MASFLRGKQAGMAKDLSASIPPSLFSPDEQARYGINSQISCLAYDPVQSLLAVGTAESRFGAGRIYVFGQRRCHKLLRPTRAGAPSFRAIRFADNGRLVSLDARNEVAVWDLDTGERLAGTTAAGVVACLVVDPMLDWALLGQTNGDVLAYDLDRLRMSPFRVGNFWKDRDGGGGLGSRGVRPSVSGNMLSMQLHPRDVGQLLIGYAHGAVVYSFKQNRTIKFFEYVLPPGAPGAGGSEDITRSNVGVERRPRLTHAVWHPTGTFILTAHEDGSLVFWDAKEGRVVMARSLCETHIDRPSSEPTSPRQPQQGNRAARFIQIDWCCKKSNSEDTGILVAGGQSPSDPERGLTFLELGPTPVYATSSWQILSDHFKGKKQIVLPTPPGADVLDYVLLPRESPHFAGAQDPLAVLALLSSGEMITLSFPSGYPISPTNQLHPSLSLVHPFVTRVAAATISRSRWLGMTETRSQGGEPLLKGGAESVGRTAAGTRRRQRELRNIAQVAHADGTIRIWDVGGHGDQIENPLQLQVDVATALHRFEDVEITAMSMASATGEFAVGTKTGELVVYRWGQNRSRGGDDSSVGSNPGGLTDISSRAEKSLTEGLQPLTLYEMMQGPISAVRVSDVGFVAVGSEGGFLSVIDLRGPSIIYHVSMSEFSKQEKRSSFIGGKKHQDGATLVKEWPVVIEFGVMTLEGDSYSSIACFVGTNTGKVITLKLLPSGGSYTAKVAGVADVKDRVVAICPIVVDTGATAAATGEAVAGLRTGQQVNGTLVVVTQTEIRIFKPASVKGASKSFDNVFCNAAAVTQPNSGSAALIAIFGDKTARAFGLPSLKELSRAPLPMLDPPRITAALVAPGTGDIVGWAGPSELVVVPVWGEISAAGNVLDPAEGGAAKGEKQSNDTMINPDLAIPPRPTISNLQWISGTQYLSPVDLDLLIGGPDRPPSKRMMAAAAEEERRLARGGRAAGASTAAGAQEGWGEYLTRQLNERTEKLNIMGDGMDNLENSSSRWADNVDSFVSKQKRSILLGGLSKFL